MKALLEEGILSCVKEVIGISAGSLFALLWVLGYTPAEIETLALHFDFNILQSVEPESVLQFMEKFGLDSGLAIERLVISILKQKGFGVDATLGEIYKENGMTFRCYATELQTCKIREFSTRGTPHVPVRFAIRASMSLPFLYEPVKERGSNVLLMDGGLLHNLPMVFLNEEEAQETWGVMFVVDQKGKAETVEDVMQFLRFVYDSAMIMKTSLFLEKFQGRVICIPSHEFSSVDFGVEKEKRAQMIQTSFDITKEFLFTKGTKGQEQAQEQGQRGGTRRRRFSAA
jgi:predicted acylesterase/phospholipase RssA